MTTTFADVPVSFIPSLELTNDFDAPESNIACVIASSIALASAAQCSRLAFLFSMRRAQRREAFEMGRLPVCSAGVANAFGGSAGGGGASPEATR